MIDPGSDEADGIAMGEIKFGRILDEDQALIDRDFAQTGIQERLLAAGPRVAG